MLMRDFSHQLAKSRNLKEISDKIARISAGILIARRAVRGLCWSWLSRWDRSLTRNEIVPYSDQGMKMRLASLFLLLVLLGGAFAGVPLNFGESHCSMGSAMDSECCKAMLLQQSQAKFTQEEELLCVLSCAQNGTTLPSSVVRVTPPAQTIQPAHPALVHLLPIPSLISRATHTHSPPGSPPAYLRNLALLI